ncbi:MAG: LysR family transcriptional regulator [Paracoccaceae bacterium]
MIVSPDWRHFPALSALRAFEATARLGGFSAAARHLNVTPAAIAQQVRALEEHTGRALARREGRALALTPEGEALSRILTEGFRQIETGLAETRGPREGAPLRVTMTPGFARYWLMPRLGRFWAAHPEVPLVVHTELAVVDLARQGLDLGIRFGAGHWPGVEAEFLTPAAELIVGAPSLLGGRTCLGREDLHALPWALVDDDEAEFDALRAQGLDPARLRINFFPSGDLCIAAAQQGYGLTVLTDKLAQAEIAAGRLVAVGARDIEGLAYYIVSRRIERRPEEAKFIRWLKREAGTARSGPAADT